MSLLEMLAIYDNCIGDQSVQIKIFAVMKNNQPHEHLLYLCDNSNHQVAILQMHSMVSGT